MILINTGSYPLQSADECIKAYMELPPIPDYMTEKGLYFRYAEEKGIEYIHILEFDDVKYSDATEFVSKRLKILSRVPGFNCSSQPWAPVEVALKHWGY